MYVVLLFVCTWYVLEFVLLRIMNTPNISLDSELGDREDIDLFTLPRGMSTPVAMQNLAGVH